jgi:predicted DNA-binding protein
VARKEDERLHIRISSKEKERLRAIASEHNKAIAEVVKEHLKSLSDPKNK